MHGAYRAITDESRYRRLAFIDRLCNDLPVYSLTIEIARALGRIEGQQASLGVVIPFEDLTIGVTALHLGFSVATLNVRHFQTIPGLPVVTF